MKSKSENFTDDCPAHLTGLVDKHLRESLLKRLKLEGYDLSGEQLNLLLYAFENDGISQKELTERSKKKKFSAVKTINQLELKNLVVRIQHSGDLRNNNIHLTALGKKLKGPLLELVEAHRTEVFRGVSAADMTTYKRTLRQMMKNIR
jgi:DNA-binding MarR family transcriptional regulator